MWFVNDSTGFAGGDSGVILNTYDYGNSWINTIVGSSHSNVSKIYFIGDTLGLALFKSYSSPGTYGVFYTINLNGSTGISELNEINKISIFPNPNKGIFSIRSTDAFQINKPMLIEIMDLNGKTVYEEFLESVSDPINVQSNYLKPGVYLLKLCEGNDLFYTKLLIQ